MNQTDQIFSDIKDVKIQGATNIAKAAIRAYKLSPTPETKKILLGLRPTEPTLSNTLWHLEKWPAKKVLGHFERSQNKINALVTRLLKGKKVVYTHCHSTNVVRALIFAKKKGRVFEVFNTETRPLYQGRLTAAELAKAGIKVTTYVDAAFHEAIPKADIVLIGADALVSKGAINKIGSATIAELARLHHLPLYIIADSWKFSPKTVPIEERDFHEVWASAPAHIKVRDPAFELIEKKYIISVISELGVLPFEDFLKQAERERRHPL